MVNKHIKQLILATGLALWGSLSQANNLTQCLDKVYTLQLLGSGGPISDDARASSGALIWWQGKSRILIDAGGGVYLRFGQSGAQLENIELIGISHFHTDHSADLPAILKGSYFFDSKNKSITIAGPNGDRPFPGLKKYLHRLFDADIGAYAYLAGLNNGSDGLLALKPIEVDTHTKQPTKIFEHDGLTVSALGIPHGDVPTLAYRIDSPQGRIVISADQNGTNDAFITFARNADVLVMPAAIVQDAPHKDASLHARPATVGQIAAKTHAKMLVLNHFMGKSLYEKDETIAIIKKYYHGPIYAGRDLACFPLASIQAATKS